MISSAEKFLLYSAEVLCPSARRLGTELWSNYYDKDTTVSKSLDYYDDFLIIKHGTVKLDSNIRKNVIRYNVIGIYIML